MARTKADMDLKARKAALISKRMLEVVENPMILNMLDEVKLDLLILALGLGDVEIVDEAED